MGSILEVKNLNFKYQQKELFHNFSFAIEEGDFVCLAGPCGCGKTTLAKMMVGLIPSFDSMFFNNQMITLDNINDIRRYIGIVFENPENSFIGHTVIEDMAFTLENIGMEKQEIRKRLDEVYTLLDIEHLLDRDPSSLSGGEKQKVALASVLVMKPKLLILDEALSMIDYYEKEKIFKILKRLNKEGMTIILLSHDVYEILHCKHIIGIASSRKVEYKNTLDMLTDEDMVRILSLEQPFMIDLSLKLKLYELIDDVILDKKEMVNLLWK